MSLSFFNPPLPVCVCTADFPFSCSWWGITDEESAAVDTAMQRTDFGSVLVKAGEIKLTVEMFQKNLAPGAWLSSEVRYEM
jgi:hypothetical protein